MHPVLWKVPGIDLTIPAYGFFMVVGIVLALWIAIHRARRRSLDPAVITSMSIIGLVLGVIGCRLMYLVHHDLGRLFSGEMSVREIISLQAGRDVMGGVILGMLGVMAFLRWTRKSVLRYLDVTAPSLVLAMGIGRIGCFMFGCCWGGVCEVDHGEKGVPWAVQFPYGSPPYLRQVEKGEIEPPAALYWKLPKAEEPELIPREVLSTIDIDDDTMLLEWAEVAERYAAEGKIDKDSPKARELLEQQKALFDQLRDRPPDLLLAQVAAAIHLRNLAAHGDGEPTTWAALRELAAAQHSEWVHPAQLYDAIALVLLFFVLSAILRRSHHPGMVLAWMLILYSVNRFLQEIIRSDNLADSFFDLLTISQFASAIMLLVGVGLAMAVRQQRPAA